MPTVNYANRKAKTRHKPWFFTLQCGLYAITAVMYFIPIPLYWKVAYFVLLILWLIYMLLTED